MSENDACAFLPLYSLCVSELLSCCCLPFISACYCRTPFLVGSSQLISKLWSTFDPFQSVLFDFSEPHHIFSSGFSCLKLWKKWAHVLSSQGDCLLIKALFLLSFFSLNLLLELSTFCWLTKSHVDINIDRNTTEEFSLWLNELQRLSSVCATTPLQSKWQAQGLNSIQLMSI